MRAVEMQNDDDDNDGKDDRAPVAHLVVHRAVTREVVSSRLRPDQHSGSLNN